MSNDDSNSNSNSNSRGDEDDADNYTFDCITAPYGRSCVSVDRMVRTSLLLLCYYINLVIRINHGIPLTFSFFSFSLLKNIETCEEHQAKQHRMESYYYVPQGGKVTDNQRHSYRDDDERRETAEMDTALLNRFIHSNDEEEIGNRNGLQLFDSITAPHGIIYVPNDANVSYCCDDLSYLSICLYFLFIKQYLTLFFIICFKFNIRMESVSIY